MRLGNRTAMVDLIDLPESADNATLLGIDASEDLGIVINTPQRAWHYTRRNPSVTDQIVTQSAVTASTAIPLGTPGYGTASRISDRYPAPGPIAASQRD